MTEKDDDKLVRKGAFKKLLMDKYRYAELPGMDEAINQLPAEPESKDCVERDKVFEAIEAQQPDRQKKYKNISLIISIQDLPSVLPARQARPDKEIEKAIKRLTLEPPPKKLKHLPWGWRQSLANLLLWVFKQKQGETFAHTDEGLLGKEKTDD